MTAEKLSCEGMYTEVEFMLIFPKQLKLILFYSRVRRALVVDPRPAEKQD